MNLFRKRDYQFCYVFHFEDGSPKESKIKESEIEGESQKNTAGKEVDKGESRDNTTGKKLDEGNKLERR